MHEAVNDDVTFQILFFSVSLQLVVAVKPGNFLFVANLAFFRLVSDDVRRYGRDAR